MCFQSGNSQHMLSGCDVSQYKYNNCMFLTYLEQKKILSGIVSKDIWNIRWEITAMVERKKSDNLLKKSAVW